MGLENVCALMLKANRHGDSWPLKLGHVIAFLLSIWPSPRQVFVGILLPTLSFLYRDPLEHLAQQFLPALGEPAISELKSFVL